MTLSLGRPRGLLSVPVTVLGCILIHPQFPFLVYFLTNYFPLSTIFRGNKSKIFTYKWVSLLKPFSSKHFLRGQCLTRIFCHCGPFEGRKEQIVVKSFVSLFMFINILSFPDYVGFRLQVKRVYIVMQQ